jgi:transposase-like protein/IS1 family transposase
MGRADTARAKQPKQIMQMTVAQFEATFPNEVACDRYLVARRWPQGIHCPRCGSAKAYELKTMPFKWECPDCREGGAYRFSHLVGTIFENTNVDLRQWFRVIHLMLTSKKGISARQVHRYMGFGSYKTAWYICHRIRAALANKHWDKRDGGTGPTGKTPIIGAVSRKGNVVARVIDRVDVATLTKFVAEAVSDKVSLLCTDNWTGYTRLGKRYPHGVVDHLRGEYVVGTIHTQTIEGFWSIFKCGVMGTFHNVSKKYLPLYVAEFEFRYNHRHNPEIFDAAVRCC